MARWFSPFAVALFVVALAISATGVLGPASPLLLPGAAAVGFIVYRLQRSRGGLDAAWSGAALGAPLPPTLVGSEPISAGILRPCAEPARGSVARSLSRIEAVRLALNPWFAVGIGFWLILIAVFGVLWVADAEWSWWELFGLLPAFAHPFVGCAIVAVHRDVTRARRDGATELFDSCPADEAARTRGFLLTAWVPLVTCLCLAGVLVALVMVRNPNTFGPIDRRAVVDVLVIAILPVGGTFLGVALGRWAPWTVVPIVAVVAVAGLNSLIDGMGSSSYEPVRSLVTWTFNGHFDPWYFEPPVWERLAWLGGLTVVVGGIALLHAGRDRRVIAALVGGATVALIAAVAAAQPLTTSEAAEMASRIGTPEAHETCTPAGPDVQVCVPEPYSSLGGRLAEEVRPVALALPEGWTDEQVSFRMLFNGDISELPDAVRVHMPDEPPEARESLFVGHTSHPESALAARFRLAAHSMGLSTVPGEDQTAVGGQARGAIVAWLAVRGVDVTSRLLAHRPADHGVVNPGDIWPGLCHDETGVVVWAPQDLDAARAMLDRPEAAVLGVLHGDWDHWRDPATTTDELMAALDLPAVGPADPIDLANADACV